MKKFTLLQLFSLLDGRLSTNMDDIYEMLDWIMNDSLMTHHLPVAMGYLRIRKPQWFIDGQAKLASIEQQCPVRDSVGIIDKENPDQFKWMIGYILKNDNPTIEVPQLVITEADKKEFGDYMVANSLLLNRLSK